MITVAVTGHRPDKLGGYGEDVFNRTVVLVKTNWTIGERPDYVITGMALGFDQAVAQACIDLGIPFTAAIPFAGQESTWPEASQMRYRRLLMCASDKEFVTERGTMPVYKAMSKRNEWMVDRCQKLVALWDGSFGGTHNCVVYAKKQGRQIENLWEQFDALSRVI